MDFSQDLSFCFSSYAMRHALCAALPFLKEKGDAALFLEES